MVRLDGLVRPGAGDSESILARARAAAIDDLSQAEFMGALAERDNAMRAHAQGGAGRDLYEIPHDAERTDRAVRQIEGRRLTYRRIGGPRSAPGNETPPPF